MTVRFQRWAAMAAAIGVMAAAGSALAADATGVWKTSDGDGIEVFRCAAALCGKILGDQPAAPGAASTDVKNKDTSLRSRPLKGMVIMTGFTGGPAVWSDGKIYNPEDGNTYSGSISLTPDNTLKLKGCALSVLCQTQVWTRK